MVRSNCAAAKPASEPARHASMRKDASFHVAFRSTPSRNSSECILLRSFVLVDHGRLLEVQGLWVVAIIAWEDLQSLNHQNLRPLPFEPRLPPANAFTGALVDTSDGRHLVPSSRTSDLL